MQRSTNNLIIMNSIFITSLLVANVVAGKVVDLFGFIVPAAVVAYGITFLCTDVIGEIWGKEQASRTVKMGLITQLLTLALVLFAIALPPAVFAQEYSEMFGIVLGQSVRIVIASLIAYLIAQFNDVTLFHYFRKKTQGQKKWIRNNASTMVSQLIDTAIFITIAFWGIVPGLGWMIISQYFVKLIIAAVDTPFFYLLTRDSERLAEEDLIESISWAREESL